jgi:hypothetical protein
MRNKRQLNTIETPRNNCYIRVNPDREAYKSAWKIHTKRYLTRNNWSRS